MANTFKTVTFAAEPASAGTPYVMYTVAGSTTTVVLGLVLANIHTAQVTATVRLVSDTGSRGGSNNVTNGTSIIVKNNGKNNLSSGQNFISSLISINFLENPNIQGSVPNVLVIEEL